MTKSEKGHVLRQSILRLLNRHGSMGLNNLAVRLSEPRRVVLGHLNLMIAGKEVAIWETEYTKVYVPKVRITKVAVDGGAVRAPLKPSVVNRSANKAPIKNQCADSRGAGPRQSVGRGIFGL
jgi:hypothetical protein